jgi:hypothetical protein
VASLGGIGGVGAFAMSIWRWRKNKRLKRLSRELISFARTQRKNEPNIYCHPTSQLAQQLGKESFLIEDVLDFMREKGWATPMKNPPDCWQIL